MHSNPERPKSTSSVQNITLGESKVDCKTAEKIDAFEENASSTQDTAASSEDPIDTPMPVFLEDVDPEQVDIPTFLTRTNARQLLGMQPGESIKDTLARLARERQEE